MEEKDSPEFVTALARGLSVIRAFGESRTRMTLADMAKATGLSRATVRRFLLTLKALDYVDSDGRQFWLTPKILTLGYAYLTSSPLPQKIQPFLEQVSETTGQSCSASILHGDEIIYIARSATKRIMSVGLNVGTRLPAYSTAMGRVLLAELPPAALDEYFSRVTLERHTEKTVTDARELRHILAAIRQQGWALVDEELEMGLRALAVPVRDSSGRVVAAMNIGADAGRITSEEMTETFLPSLQAAAENLRPLLGS
ncbi:IclR family transcriptional regulator [Telmatospirillum sp. J64-1]|uniref:IclR family transcriptional regulator n=1 Tax=Telmatospirillum sp. J64-1 TaxID=2502183 RepID=UPI00115EBEDF|nr:IclR family transcriptional regulator [Telmatospirillum sp. J64-1]